MMKKTFLLKPMLLLLAMIAGVGSVWGQDADVTYNIADGDWIVEDGALTNGTVSFTGAGSANFKKNSGYFMMGKSGAYINFPTYSSAVEKIVVTGNSGASSSTKMNIFVGETAVSTETTGCTGTNTYEIAEDYQAEGTQYTLKVTSNHNAQITKIEIFYASGTPSTEWIVTYDGNGATSGTVPTDDTVYDPDNNTVTVLSNTGNLAKEHYSFNGWNTKADGTGTGYVAGNTFTISANTTLFAQWAGNTHTVTLPADDTYGSYSMNVESPVAYGTEVTLTYTPAANYENYGATWSVNGTELEGNTFSMPDENVTVTVAVAEVQDYATLPFEFDGGKSDIATTVGLTQQGLGSDYNSTPKLKFDGTGDWMILKINEEPGMLSFDIKNNSFSGGTFTVQESADGETYTDLKKYTTIDGTQNEKLYPAATTRYIKWVYTEKSKGNVGLGNIALAKPDKTPSIVISEEEISLDAAEHEGTISVTYKNVDTDAVEIKFCDANGADATYDWIAADFNPDKNIEYQISANTGDERTAYLKVYGLDAEAGDVYSNVVTITQAAPISGVTYAVANTIVPGRHYLVASGTDGNVYAMGSQKSTNRNAVAITASNGTIIVPSTEEVYEVQIEVDKDGYFTLYDAAYNEGEGGYLYAAGGTGSNHLKTQAEVDNTAQWIITFDDSNVATIKANMTGRNWMRFNDGNSKIFSCYISGQEDIYLFERVDDTSRQLTLPVAPAKTYTSFCRAYDLDFTNVEGIEAYVVSDLTDNSAVITKVDKVAAGEGVILKKTGDAASFEIPFAESAEKVSDNKMVGVTVATDMTEVANAYILSDGLFYECSGGTLAAGKAYLVAADWAESTAPSFSIVEGGEATGIKSLTPALSQGEEVYYDLSGRRVEKPAKGVYIVNGKKVLVP